MNALSLEKTLSWLLITLLLGNVFGYYGVFLGLAYRNDLAMIRALDTESYSEAEAITFKVPIAVPYATNARDYERVNGQFESNGEFFRLVKQKLAQDTLYIVCVKDSENKRIHEALADLVKTFTDRQGTHESSGQPVLAFTKDYMACTVAILCEASGWESGVANARALNMLIPTFSSSIIHPPERA